MRRHRLSGRPRSLLERRVQAPVGFDAAPLRASTACASSRARLSSRSRSAIAVRSLFGGHQVDPVAVADVVDLQAMREIVAHPNRPCASPATACPCRRNHKAFSAVLLWAVAPSVASSSPRLCRAASEKSPPATAARHSSIRRPSDETSLRTLRPSPGSPSPSSRCSASMMSTKRSVSATLAACASSPPSLQPHQDQRRNRRKHREAAVERIRRRRPPRTSAAGAPRASQPRTAPRRAPAAPLIGGTGSGA